MFSLLLTRQAEVYYEIILHRNRSADDILNKGSRPKKAKTMSPVMEHDNDDDFVDTNTSKSR